MDIEDGHFDFAEAKLRDVWTEVRRSADEKLRVFVHYLLIPCMAHRGDWDRFDAHLQAATRAMDLSGFADQDAVLTLELAADLAAGAEPRRGDRARDLAARHRQLLHSAKTDSAE